MSAGKNKPRESTKNGNISTGRSDMEIPVTERKLYLEKECKILTNYINTYLGKVEQLLQENKCLEKEAKQYQEESSTYLSYIRKHRQKCQNLIITLNDQNHADLSQVWAQKETLISQYTEKEEEVRSSLTNVETKYSLTNKELEDLEPFKDKVEHTKKIEELEKELLVTKIQHADEMHRVRSGFQQAKADCELEFDQKMQVLTRTAEAAAMQALFQHITEVKAENWQLCRQLHRLIQHSTALKEAKAELREQQQQLHWELQCIQDMAHRRRWLHQHTVQL
ncbi:coiled-coil domain-containing protein 166 [Indicator indicator]|uniref:coiled-coil domain-containing protein 166 n=1 Tax=Indicator indicator TaxID=1002788 RepID=UPI0023DF9EAB|nr:coiled-coil domain-containing protein 166 [Indicator indicator]